MLKRHQPHEYNIESVRRSDCPLIIQGYTRKGGWQQIGEPVLGREQAVDRLEEAWQAVRMRGDCSVTIRQFRAVAKYPEDVVIMPLSSATQVLLVNAAIALKAGRRG